MSVFLAFIDGFFTGACALLGLMYVVVGGRNERLLAVLFLSLAAVGFGSVVGHYL